LVIYFFFLISLKKGKSRHREKGKEEEEEGGGGKQAFVGVPVVFARLWPRVGKVEGSRRQQRRKK
jgi:hypothetical protein